MTVLHRKQILKAVKEATTKGGPDYAGIGIKEACNLIGISDKRYYNWMRNPDGTDKRRALKERGAVSEKHNSRKIALTKDEKEVMVGHLLNPEYADLSIRDLCHALQANGIYLASERSYRRVALAYNIPCNLGKRTKLSRALDNVETSKELSRRLSCCATEPNMVWMWDISYFKWKGSGEYVYLFLAVDLYSRKIVGARFYRSQSAENAVEFFQSVFEANKIPDNSGLTIHFDNGKTMRARETVAKLKEKASNLSTSRPYKSNDNPYVESLFDSLKNGYGFKVDNCFEIEQCNSALEAMVYSYNYERCHRGINFGIPAIRHRGIGVERDYFNRLRAVQEKHKEEHPERYISNSIRNYEPAGPQFLNPDKMVILDAQNKEELSTLKNLSSYAKRMFNSKLLGVRTINVKGELREVYYDPDEDAQDEAIT